MFRVESKACAWETSTLPLRYYIFSFKRKKDKDIEMRRKKKRKEKGILRVIEDSACIGGTDKH